MTIAVSRTAGLPAAVYALSVGSFGIGTTEFVIMGLLLDVAHDFHISITLAAWSITAYACGVVIGAPLLTPLLSRYPKKPALLFLMILFSIGNLGCGIAGNMTMLIIFRVITALAHASFFGISSVYAAELAPVDKRASAVSAVFLGATLANILGVPLGAWVGQYLGWRYTFFMVTLIGILSALAVIALVPGRQAQPAVQSRIRDELKVLRHPTVLRSLLITALGFSGVFAAFTYIAPMLKTVTGMSEHLIPPVLVLFGVGMVAGNHLGGRLTDGGVRRALLLTLALLIVVLCLFPFAIQTLPGACAAVFLLGAAMFSTIPPLQMQALDSSETGKSMVSSCNIAAFNLGNAAGAWFGGLLLTAGVSLSHIPLAGACLTASGFIIASVTLSFLKGSQA
ncbi:MFS transporter [Klebsiella variicola]|uniref:MFS transporter n=1 Tax=Klebsiella variicola TaxID=244366 RepID=UPI00097CC2D0|nr:MFS transporter [Klebsiella variicola]HBQ5885965.1 MFS transporter [Klebsiella variicola subsp. variicola]AQL15885.1 arabinose transporter permease [Klebsiella variicola]AQL20972.1 MFS transporter [Klebsiella variicola]AQL26739.1 arabinose transporter permease [Klebsiella variicola]ELA0490039.1 MFS transporter [Klebsiella variicola]